MPPFHIPHHAAVFICRVPGWTHGNQVKSIIGRRELWIVTLVNSIFPGASVSLAIRLWNKPTPSLAFDYWIIHCMGLAITMRYVPCLFRHDEGAEARL
jgi:hypothetical protein